MLLGRRSLPGQQGRSAKAAAPRPRLVAGEAFAAPQQSQLSIAARMGTRKFSGDSKAKASTLLSFLQAALGAVQPWLCAPLQTLCRAISSTTSSSEAVLLAACWQTDCLLMRASGCWCLRSAQGAMQQCEPRRDAGIAAQRRVNRAAAWLSMP